MGMRVLTRDLHKVYKTPPPAGTPGSSIDRQGNSTVVALDGVSLEVRPAEIFGLLGPNGAGKSTTIGILTTRIRASAGEAWIGPYEAGRQRVDVKKVIGVVQQKPNLDLWLTAREILEFHAAYFGIGKAERRKNAGNLLERFQLAERADHLVNGFSGGMMQRLAVARAMMHNPSVLFLDEPSASLDTQTRLLLWEIIREYRAVGKTILLSTHNMEEADALCDRIAIIDHGKLIALGTPAELKGSVQENCFLLKLRFSREPNGMAGQLARLPGVSRVQLRGTMVDVYADRGGELVGPIAAAASAEGLQLCDLMISEPTLEDLFLYHTGRSLRQ